MTKARLEQAIELINTERKTLPKAITRMKMKPMCETRWVEKHKCLEDFYELFEALINCLRLSQQSQTGIPKRKQMPVACSFRLQVQLCCVHSAQYLIYLDILTILLQGSTINIVTAYEKVKLAHDEIMLVRNNAEDKFHSIFEKATAMAETAGRTISIPRTVKRQTLRGNVDACRHTRNLLPPNYLLYRPAA